MEGSIQKFRGDEAQEALSVKAEEILSLNLDDLDISELERRLEMAVAMVMDACGIYQSCSCGSLSSCGTYCT